MAAAVRAALYLRVSTGRQADNDLSIPDQRRQAKGYCTSRGWEIAVGSSRVPPARASEARRLGNTHAITRCGEPLQLGPRALNGLCDDEGVPLICPTCQVLAQSVLTGDRRLLCMGLFSIFWLEAKATRRGCENPA